MFIFILQRILIFSIGYNYSIVHLFNNQTFREFHFERKRKQNTCLTNERTIDRARMINDDRIGFNMTSKTMFCVS